MASLDTNLLLRLLLRDNLEQTQLVEVLLSQGENYYVSDMVFAEMAWVLQGPIYRQDRHMIAKNIAAILGIPTIDCNRALLHRVLPLYVAHPAVSFTDICLGVYAELHDAAPLLTFDKRLVRHLPDHAQILA